MNSLNTFATEPQNISNCVASILFHEVFAFQQNIKRNLIRMLLYVRQFILSKQEANPKILMSLPNL